MSEQLQMLVTGLIVLLMVAAVYRSGKANPVDTGKLQSDYSKLNGRISELEGKIDDAASSAEVALIGGRIVRLEEQITHVATKEDLARLDGKIAVVGGKVEGVEAIAERTDETVTRIWQSIMNTAPALQPSRPPRPRK